MKPLLGTLILAFALQFASAQVDYVRDPEGIQLVKDEVYQRVILPTDDVLRLDIKYQMVDYLVDTTLTSYLENLRRAGRQDEDDGDGPADNTQVLNGVRRILQNVFAGNLAGIIQESVSVQSPGAVQVFFADVLGSLFGSNAVKGAGTIGLAQPNATDAQNATNMNGVNGVNAPGFPGQYLPPNQQLYAPNQQLNPGQLAIQQQQQQGGLVGVIPAGAGSAAGVFFNNNRRPVVHQGGVVQIPVIENFSDGQALQNLQNQQALQKFQKQQALLKEIQQQQVQQEPQPKISADVDDDDEEDDFY